MECSLQPFGGSQASLGHLMSKEIVSSPTNDAVGELEQQVTALQDEKNSLVSENEMMNEKLDQLDGSFDDPNTMVAKKYFHAQLQLEQLQEENFRATSDKANKLESTVEIYRQKLQDLNDLRKQTRGLAISNGFMVNNYEVQKINELEAALQKKDEDMKAMEERYKMYLEKARNIKKKKKKAGEPERMALVLKVRVRMHLDTFTYSYLLRNQVPLPHVQLEEVAYEGQAQGPWRVVLRALPFEEISKEEKDKGSQ
ncbi:HOOK1 [Cervus elaphus hippelaphus]|uniref:HOOK1 n=1 Tax=Cervus elaphus hippelaphus TaxID=46360 RepID=A0A212CFR0_CEREH|nr:HOOK1 [Cervus elaphus hippelaphus]